MCIDITNNVTIEVNLTLIILTQEDSATSNDFTRINETFSVNGPGCFSIDILSDDIVEDNETFVVMVDSDDSRLIVLPGGSNANITIIDTSSKLLQI